MPVEPEIFTVPATGGVKAFLLAHPVGVAIVGGTLIGMGVYYIAKKWSSPKEEAVKA
jgi:predicted transporter